MPIKAENRDRYPEDWAEIRREILLRCGDRCEQCGVRNKARGAWARPNPDMAAVFFLAGAGATPWMTIEGVGRRVTQIVLTIHHVDKTPENNEHSNLMALCQRCHLGHHQGDARQAILRRGHANQLELEGMEL